MAKAKDWAARFDAAPEIGAELQQFMAEIGEIARARGNTPNGVEGAVREQKAKYMAVCRLTARVTPELWPALMSSHGAEYMAAVRKYLKTAKKPSSKKKWRKKKVNK